MVPLAKSVCHVSAGGDRRTERERDEAEKMVWGKVRNGFACHSKRNEVSKKVQP